SHVDATPPSDTEASRRASTPFSLFPKEPLSKSTLVRLGVQFVPVPGRARSASPPGRDVAFHTFEGVVMVRRVALAAVFAAVLAAGSSVFLAPAVLAAAPAEISIAGRGL